MILYYLPGMRAASREQVHAAGLAHAFPDGVSLAQVHAAGPDDGDGLVIGAESKGLGHFPDRQTWTKAPGGRFWVGLTGEVSPTGLARREQIDGHLVRLGDGQEWLVPVARSFVRGSMLPAALVLGPDGEVVREALPRFAHISATAERVERMFFGQANESESEDMDLDEGFATAVEALALNYRVGPAEVSALRLLTDVTVAHVLRALVDVPTILEVAREQEEASKKNAPADTPDGSSSSDGAEV